MKKNGIKNENIHIFLNFIETHTDFRHFFMAHEHLTKYHIAMLLNANKT